MDKDITTGPTFDITHSEKDPDLHPGRDLSSADFAAEHTSGTPQECLETSALHYGHMQSCFPAFPFIQKTPIRSWS